MEEKEKVEAVVKQTLAQHEQSVSEIDRYAKTGETPRRSIEDSLVLALDSIVRLALAKMDQINEQAMIEPDKEKQCEIRRQWYKVHDELKKDILNEIRKKDLLHYGRESDIDAYLKNDCHNVGSDEVRTFKLNPNQRSFQLFLTIGDSNEVLVAESTNRDDIRKVEKYYENMFNEMNPSMSFKLRCDVVQFKFVEEKRKGIYIAKYDRGEVKKINSIQEA